MHMTYNTAMIVWVLLAFTTAFAFWSGVIKAIRLLGSAKEQGRLYRFLQLRRGAVLRRRVRSRPAGVRLVRR